MKRIRDTLPKLLFLGSLLVIAFSYGFISHRMWIFPAGLIGQAEVGFAELFTTARGDLPFHLAKTNRREKIVVHRPGLMAPGLTLVTYMGPGDGLFVDVLERDGRVIHRWRLDWFDMWPDATHLPEDVKPKSPPGTHIHGALLMENGDLVFNYEEFAMVRVNPCGRALWRLAYRTHHALWRDDEGYLWAPGIKTHFEPLPGLSYYKPRFEEHTIVQVRPEDGRILREISLFDLFKKNGLQGLLYQESKSLHPEMTGDSLHLNDVEIFSRRMKPGFFQPGDMMISLRNINAVLVFDLKTEKKKFLSIGPFARQHDPDFLDGHTISIFDNNDVGPPSSGVQSRILKQSVPDGAFEVAFQGSADLPFFTDLLGSHEWLENGNLLIAEGRGGRAFEVAPDGRLVWEYYNIVEEGIVGLLETALRLPAEFTAEFFAERRAACAAQAAASGRSS